MRWVLRCLILSHTITISAAKKTASTHVSPVETAKESAKACPTKDDHTILIQYCDKGDSKGLVAYISHHPDLDLDVKETQYGETPLHYCALHNIIDCARVLLEQGADVNSVSGLGLTSMHYAIYDHDLQFYKLLKEFGADLTLTDHEHQETALELLKSLGYTEIVSLFE